MANLYVSVINPPLKKESLNLSSNMTLLRSASVFSPGCQLPQEQRFSRHSSNSWHMDLDIRERG